ncbi:MAG TPA: DUF5667 domain-containing protein [Ktedonobacterales bacterium]|nr:DUF5667 domain-containing protein [Ktedonobacterales bacterium]
MSEDQGDLEPWLADPAAPSDGLEINGLRPSERTQRARPRLAAELRLARALRTVEPPAEEIAEARERVRQRLAAAFDECASETKRDVWRRGIILALHVGAHARTAARATRHAAEARRPWLVAAVVLLLVAGLLGVSQAAAGALPGSPFYLVKRSQEWLVLHAPLSDTERGELLGDVARRRLAELRIVASRGDATEAHRLTRDLGATVESLIQLTSDMAARHEDTHVVANVLALTLVAEDTALSSAQQQDQALLVQALASATAQQQQAINAHHLAVPLPSPTPVPAHTHNGNGNGNGNDGKANTSPRSGSSPGRHGPPPRSLGGHRVR